MSAPAEQSRPSLVPAREKQKTILDYLRDPKVIKGLEGVATQYLTAERLARITINAMRRVPKLAECNPQSVLGAVMMTAALGLEPNTVQQHAFLIPRDKRGKLDNGQWGVVDTECQFMIGYRGYIVMAKRNPSLVKIVGSVICENDVFEHMEGSKSFLNFAPAIRDRGLPIGAFCFTKEKTEHAEVDSATVLPWDEIEKIRSRSETWKFLTQNLSNANTERDKARAEAKLAETPWAMWEGEMAAKSAIRRHIKQLDLTHGLNVVAELDAGGEMGAIDMVALADPDRAKAVADGEEPPPVKERQVEEPPPDLAQPGQQQRADKPTPAGSNAAPKQTAAKSGGDDVNIFET